VPNFFLGTIFVVITFAVILVMGLLHLPLALIVIAGLAFFATDALLLSTGYWGIAVSIFLYLSAVGVGIVAFSIEGFALSAL
jgi:hypothetical protein